ncbi:MAG: zinc-ribbon domain containing protein [Chloroflexi bacterium]|nr:zinc-ribbon domain containing protein [Chloroflexota bacterium]
MSYQERPLTCQDCAQSFSFTAEDQAFFAEKGYTNDPKRCPSCRLARRNRRPTDGFGSQGQSRAERQLYPAVCAQCGKGTQVPFQPSGTRPVYCSDCYSRRTAYSGR